MPTCSRELLLMVTSTLLASWFAAINRDLPLIMNLTLVVTLVTVACNSAADYSSKLISRQI